MKVLNLCCARQHRFEGWFASADEFNDQAARSAIACPICGDTEITRLPSAPHIAANRHGVAPARAGEIVAASTAPSMPTEMTMQSQWLRAVRHVMSSTEDVGERFAEEARRIHYGEVEERGIRGRASAEDAAALREEGIDVMALPLPHALKGPVQ